MNVSLEPTRNLVTLAGAQINGIRLAVAVTCECDMSSTRLDARLASFVVSARSLRLERRARRARTFDAKTLESSAKPADSSRRDLASAQLSFKLSLKLSRSRSRRTLASTRAARVERTRAAAILRRRAEFGVVRNDFRFLRAS